MSCNDYTSLLIASEINVSEAESSQHEASIVLDSVVESKPLPSSTELLGPGPETPTGDVDVETDHGRTSLRETPVLSIRRG
jgi:hypothetical protein